MYRSWLALVLITLLLALPSPASAQDPTPEPSVTPVPTATPTPAYMQDVPLSSGNILHVERTITYGEAAIVVAIGLFTIVLILVKAVELPKRFMQR